jgi:hypothetical protein
MTHSPTARQLVGTHASQLQKAVDGCFAPAMNKAALYGGGGVICCLTS